MRQARRFIAVLLVVGRADLAVAQTETEKLLAASDPAIQAQINAVFNVKSEAEASQQLARLKTITDDKAKLVKQLAIFAVTAPNRKEMHDLQTLVILHRLELAPSFQIHVLAPCLGSENEQLREFAHEWFEMFDHPVDEDRWRAYGSYVAGKVARKDDVPAALVEYLYERSPDRALLIFMRAGKPGEITERLNAIRRKMEAIRQQSESGVQDNVAPPQDNPQHREVNRQRNERRREILLAEHIVSNAIWLRKNEFHERFQQALPEVQSQLAKLAKHDEWWARLYVAQIMRRHRELRLTEVLDKLRGMLTHLSARRQGR